jgi:hypothetical protein
MNQELNKLNKFIHRPDVMVFLILLSASLVVYGSISLRILFQYDEYKSGEYVYSHMGLFQDNTQYGISWSNRLLTPLLASLIPLQPTYSYFILNWIFTFFTAFIYYLFLKEIKFDIKTSLIGSLLFLSNYVVSGWFGSIVVDPLEHLFWILGFYFLLKKKTWQFFLVLILGLFNKENIILLVPFYFFITFNIFNTFLMGIVSFVVLSLLRFLYKAPGQKVYSYIQVMKEVVPVHIQRWYNFITYIPAMFGIMWLLALINYKRAHPFVKRSVFILPFIFAQLLVAHSIIQGFFLAYPIIITLALYSIKDLGIKS